MSDKLPGALETNKFAELIEDFIAQAEPDTMSFEAFDQGARRLEQQTLIVGEESFGWEFVGRVLE